MQQIIEVIGCCTIAAYWDYEEEYGLCQNAFSSVLSMTTPNRLMLLAGDTPVSENYGPPPYITYNNTIMGQLDMAGISWGYYDYLEAFGSRSNVYLLIYTSGMSPSTLNNVRNVSDLYQELSSGSGLPAVSFVNSLGKPSLTEHPPFDPTMGELWVVSVVNGAMESSYWNSTAIFITWDEGGGYYDHVVPPAEFTIDHGFKHELVGFGQRVPLLAISPYSKENYVSNTLLSHLSLIRIIDYNWNIRH